MIERQDIINECSLIMHLNSPQLIQCVEVYDFRTRIWVILELMEGGSLTNICMAQRGRFQESFIRWTLF